MTALLVVLVGSVIAAWLIMREGCRVGLHRWEGNRCGECGARAPRRVK